MALTDRLVVSNIAWTNDEEPLMANKLQKLGVKFLEIAPTKLWGEPSEVTDAQIEEYVSFWKQYGITIVAFQSVLFKHPEMQIFADETKRNATQQCLMDYIRLAGKMGVRVIVFGSPKNRKKGELSDADAQTIAKDFFGTLGDAAKDNGLSFCIEPNPPEYACDFVTNTEQGVALVEAVDNTGFRLHLDIAGMSMVGDDITASIKKAAPYLKHFHMSAPQLGPVEARQDVDYKEAIRALDEVGYAGFVSIEMRPASEQGANIARVEQAVKFVRSL